MSPGLWNGFLWLLLFMGPFLLLQRALQREWQVVFLLLTRRPQIALALFALLFFPGVLLHESSHFLMARLLQVPTGRFSLIPRPLPNGRLLLGSVETAATDWFRDALIGVAPLLTGGAFVAFAGVMRLGMVGFWQSLLENGWAFAPQALRTLYAQPDFWLWFYLAFAVSSTMLPSASDRRAWLPVLLVMFLLLGVSLLAGAGPWLVAHLAPVLKRSFQAVTAVLGISAAIQIVLLLPLFFFRKMLERILGLQIA